MTGLRGANFAFQFPDVGRLAALEQRARSLTSLKMGVKNLIEDAKEF